MSQFGAPANWQPLRFRKDESIYFEGDTPAGWFVVESGVARTCRFHADGHRQLTGFHYEGDVFGLDEGSRLEAAEAVTDMTCWYLPNRMAGGEGLIAAEAQQVFKKALENAHRCIFLFGRRSAQERLAAFILMLAARQRVRNDVELSMSRSDIADYLGLTIHTVSRTLSQLCQERMILLEGPHHCRLLNHAALKRLAGESEQPEFRETELITQFCGR